MAPDEDLRKENRRLRAQLEELKKLLGEAPPSPGENPPQPAQPDKPVLVVLQRPRGWQPPEGTSSLPG